MKKGLKIAIPIVLILGGVIYFSIRKKKQVLKSVMPGNESAGDTASTEAKKQQVKASKPAGAIDIAQLSERPGLPDKTYINLANTTSIKKGNKIKVTSDVFNGTFTVQYVYAQKLLLINKPWADVKAKAKSITGYVEKA